jgi:hypothetical protein
MTLVLERAKTLRSLDRAATMIGTYTGLDKMLETLRTLHISLLIWCWTIFAFSTDAVLLGMDSTSFEQSLVEFVYHSSWKTPSSCFRDVGGGNIFPTLVSKTVQSGSVTFRCGDYADQGRCWSSPSCFKTWLNNSSCVNGGIVVLENCIVVRK